jgi:hypothetical protein
MAKAIQSYHPRSAIWNAVLLLLCAIAGGLMAIPVSVSLG